MTQRTKDGTNLYNVELTDLPAQFPRGLKKLIRAINTGIFREPRKGEFYLSGVVPTAYRAPNDLSTAFYIAELVITREIKYRQIEYTIDLETDFPDAD